jgi:hypothetical protein
MAMAGMAATERTSHARTGTKRWLVEVLVALLLVFLVWQGALVWRASDHAITHFPQALNWSTLPRPSAGYTVLTPSMLEHRQPGRSDIGYPVRYVGASTPSTGPSVVSVHPIDSDTWAAVSLGDNGTCYAVLVYSDPTNPNYGGTDYGVLPGMSPCLGRRADQATVTRQQTPQ